MEKQLLLGDEAVGLGAIHAGISGMYGYPGTPSTEIFEYVEAQTRDGGAVHAAWSTNEKVAVEESLGMSWAGKRALVSMKHVGLNVAADAFMNSAVTGINGGLVLAVADDPGMHSSQNEQDTRHFAQFALVPLLEPRDQQEAYDQTRLAFDISEKFLLPVVLRLVTRLAHSRTGVVTGGQREQNPLAPMPDWKKWTLLPSNARVQFADLVKKQEEILAFTENSPVNRLELRGTEVGIISAGIASNYIAENLPEQHEFSLLHIGLYPLPVNKIKALARHVKRILVVEDGYPFIEGQLNGLLGAPVPVFGRLTGDLPRTGELNPDLVRKAMGLPALERLRGPMTNLARRPPALCKGCPHADTYKALNEVLAPYEGNKAFADIGCYTLGAYPPYQAIGSCICMGASVGMAVGAAHAGFHPAVAVIGDSTFAHGGITALLSAVRSNTPVTVIILDNGIVAMTGMQPSMATGKTLDQLISGLGIPEGHVRVINPLPKYHEANVNVLREEIEFAGPSVIIARRPCIQSR